MIGSILYFVQWLFAVGGEDGENLSVIVKRGIGIEVADDLFGFKSSMMKDHCEFAGPEPCEVMRAGAGF